jgi:ABC-2 type transport system permease protein
MEAKAVAHSLRWWLGLGKLSLRMRVASQISYNRWSYFSLFFAQILSYLGGFVVIWVMVHAFQAVQGWNAYQVVILYALDLLAYAGSQAFVITLWDMDALVVRGGLDDYLIRPLAPLVHLIVRGFNVGYLAHICISLAALLVAYVQLGLQWDFIHWLLLVVTAAGGTLIQVALTIIPASLSFWWTRVNIAGFIRWGTREFIRYPISIYPATVRAVLTFVIPMAFVNYYPALSLLDKAPLYLWPLVTLAVGLALLMISLLVWRAGLRRYSSSGT